MFKSLKRVTIALLHRCSDFFILSHVMEKVFANIWVLMMCRTLTKDFPMVLGGRHNNRPLLEMRKLRLRKYLAKVNTFKKWQSLLPDKLPWDL